MVGGHSNRGLLAKTSAHAAQHTCCFVVHLLVLYSATAFDSVTPTHMRLARY
jgi:hypothetical protein